MQVRIPKVYTYADYLQLPQDARVELIEGVIYDMSPAPVKSTPRDNCIELATLVIEISQAKLISPAKFTQLHLM